MNTKAIRTITGSFIENAHTFADGVIVKYKKDKGKPYVDVTWQELERLVFYFASGMIGLGMEAGDRLAILSFNRLEWIVADLGTMLAGGIVVPIYHTNTPDQCAYIIQDAGASFVVVEDTVQLAKVLSTIERLENLAHIILIQGETPAAAEKVISFGELLNRGEKHDRSHEFRNREMQVTLDDMATIVYTSGTTGPPKGCMISHRNIASVLESIHQLTRIDPKTNLSLMILPISHLYPRVSGYYYNIFMNIPFAIAESLDTLGKNMLEARPTYFTSVPRIFEKLHDRIVATTEKGSLLKQLTFNWAMKIGRERSRRINDHHESGVIFMLKFGIADRLVFRKIRNMLGGRIQFAVSAGAPLSADVGEFVQSLGIRVLEFYALTETITGTMTTFDENRFGTVGKPMPGCEVCLAEDGEILIRGNNFMGYYNRPDLTKELIKEGWVFTGDIGRWDSEGFLIITDRKKDLIITSGGKNIAPQLIENMLKRIPLVSLSMVYGDQRNYLTALITLDQAETEALAKERGWKYITYEDLTRSPEINAEIGKGVDRVNQELARYETIKKFVILPREFTQEDGEITPTLKLKRKPICEKYRRLLDSMYEEA
ncbi:MAG: AMP-dependent synthetase/ligase [Desulfomonilaceae bacterium]